MVEFSDSSRKLMIEALIKQNSRLKKSVQITRIITIRKFRRVVSNPLLALLYLVPLLLILPVVIGQVPGTLFEELLSGSGAYLFGTRFKAGSHDLVLRIARGISGTMFITAMYLVVLPEISGQAHFGDRIDELLLAAHPQIIAIAAVLNHIVFAGRILGVIGLVGVIAFTIGSKSITVGVFGILAVVLLIMTSVAITYALVLIAKLIFIRVGLLKNNRALFGAPIIIGMFAVFFWFREALSVLGRTPLSWYADIVFVFVTPTAKIEQAIIISAASIVVFLFSIIVIRRIGENVWRSDPLISDNKVHHSNNTRTLVLSGIIPRPVAGVVKITWVRIYRNPKVLTFVALLGIVSSSVVLTVASQAPNALPVIVAVYAAATISAGVTLNPLGNEGSVLPAVLTTPDGPRILVSGYVISGSIPGGLFVGGATITTAIAVRANVNEIIVFSLLGFILGIGAPAIAVGLGVAFPNIGGVSAAQSSGIYPPRFIVVSLFTMLVVVVGTPAIATAIISNGGNDLASLSPLITRTVGNLTSGVAVTAIGWISIRYAINAIQQFELGE